MENICRRGQGTLEYAIVIISVAAALLATQYYVKRSIQGRFREAADSIGEQYAPGNMDSIISVTQTGTTTVVANTVEDAEDPDNKKFGLQTTTTINETTRRTGYENVGTFEESLYDD